MDREPLVLLGTAAGISDRPTGTHLSRTMMLADLRRLLAQTPASADARTYRAAVIDENVLLKPTLSTRRISHRRLCDLYLLNPELVLFHALRELWPGDDEAQPLLALLCALARDLLLRSSAELMLALPPGEPVTPQQFTAVVQAAFPDRYSVASLHSLGQNIASSWQQAGHLVGKLHKVRAQARCRPHAVAYALLLGQLQGVRGDRLFQTLWVRVLDAPQHVLHAQAQVAAQHGWLEYRRAGEVVELDFRHLLRSFPQGEGS